MIIKRRFFAVLVIACLLCANFALCEGISGVWLSDALDNGARYCLRLDADGQFSLALVTHQSDFLGTLEEWGDGNWQTWDAICGSYAARGDFLHVVTEDDLTLKVAYSVQGERIHVSNLLGTAMDFTLLGALSGTAIRNESVVLCKNDASDAEMGVAGEYYVMFSLPDCMVMELETLHIGSSAPGWLVLHGEDGVSYGPFRARGRAGQDGTENAYWTATVEISLAAGRYALEDSDPATWQAGEADGGAFSVRGQIITRADDTDIPE